MKTSRPKLPMVDQALNKALDAGVPNRKLRTETVSVRLSERELQVVDLARQSLKLTRASYLRGAACGRLPRSIPMINQAAWMLLVPAAAGLAALDEKIGVDRQFGTDEMVKKLDQLVESFDAIRSSLIGARVDQLRELFDET